MEFRPKFHAGLTIAAYLGMLLGAIFWGFGADIIGRRTAFNTSLFICSIFAITAGASPNYASLGFFVWASAFGAGGNLVLDTAVFLEYLPSSKQWLLTLMACWWGVGQLVCGISEAMTVKCALESQTTWTNTMIGCWLDCLALYVSVPNPLKKSGMLTVCFQQTIPVQQLEPAPKPTTWDGAIFGTLVGALCS